MCLFFFAMIKQYREINLIQNQSITMCIYIYIYTDKVTYSAIALSAVVVESTPTSVLDMSLNNLFVRFQ